MTIYAMMFHHGASDRVTNVGDGVLPDKITVARHESGAVRLILAAKMARDREIQQKMVIPSTSHIQEHDKNNNNGEQQGQEDGSGDWVMKKLLVKDCTPSIPTSSKDRPVQKQHQNGRKRGGWGRNQQQQQPPVNIHHSNSFHHGMPTNNPKSIHQHTPPRMHRAKTTNGDVCSSAGKPRPGQTPNRFGRRRTASAVEMSQKVDPLAPSRRSPLTGQAYAGSKFQDSPAAKDLPPPPLRWLVEAMAETNKNDSTSAVNE